MHLTQKIFMLLIVVAAHLQSKAQASEWQEAVYLKNGNIYRGVIVEQVPGESLKVQTVGGNVFTVAANDILKITKEPRLQVAPAMSEDRLHHNFRLQHPGEVSKKEPSTFYNKKKGYFFQGQIMLNLGEAGIRIINGYRAGRLAQFGIGIGADMVAFSLSNGNIFDEGGKLKSGFQGLYVPLFLHYQGDMLNRKITPFYQIDLGWGLHFSNQRSQFPMNSTAEGDMGSGGPMGGVGLGVKFQSAKRFNFRLSLNFDVKTNAYDYNQIVLDQNGSPSAPAHMRGIDVLSFPGLKFGFGF